MPPRFPPKKKCGTFTDPCPDGPVPIVICGPCGCGKTTLADRLMAEFGDCMTQSISHTTRPKRDDEEDGIAYYFIDDDAMKESVAKNEYLEYSTQGGHFYGTSRHTVQDILDSAKICLLTINVNGVQQFKNNAPELKTKYLFVRTLNKEILGCRLHNRGDTTESEIAERLIEAEKELEYSRVPGNFDEIFVNDSLDNCYLEIAIYLEPYIKSVRQQREKIKESITASMTAIKIELCDD